MSKNEKLKPCSLYDGETKLIRADVPMCPKCAREMDRRENDFVRETYYYLCTACGEVNSGSFTRISGPTGRAIMSEPVYAYGAPPVEPSETELLKSCPLCRSKADPTYPVSASERWVECSQDGCPLHGAPMPFDAWQLLLRDQSTQPAAPKAHTVWIGIGGDGVFASRKAARTYLAKQGCAYLADESLREVPIIGSPEVREYERLRKAAFQRDDKLEALILQYVRVGEDDVGDAVDQIGNALARLAQSRVVLDGEQ